MPQNLNDLIFLEGMEYLRKRKGHHLLFGFNVYWDKSGEFVIDIVVGSAISERFGCRWVLPTDNNQPIPFVTLY